MCTRFIRNVSDLSRGFTLPRMSFLLLEGNFLSLSSVTKNLLKFLPKFLICVRKRSVQYYIKTMDPETKTRTCKWKKAEKHRSKKRVIVEAKIGHFSDRPVIATLVIVSTKVIQFIF